MKRLVVVIKSDPEDGGYVATVPSLPGVVGQGETEEEAFEDVKADLEFTLESMVECGEELPPGDEVVREVELAVYDLAQATFRLGHRGGKSVRGLRLRESRAERFARPADLRRSPTTHRTPAQGT